MNETILWLWLGVKCASLTSLYSRVRASGLSVEEIYALTEAEIVANGAFTKNMASSLSDKDLSAAYKALCESEEKNVSIIRYTDELYPQKLRDIQDPPALLYCLGELRPLDNVFTLACVGTREATSYGRRTAYTVCHDVAKCGGVVVSGMAKGIDAACHSAAIDCGGYTVAVLGNGVDVVYPKENERLYRDIVRFGAVVSEYPPTVRATRFTFPKRNRIISGLCDATAVFEAASRSGALITAEDAVKQGRKLFSVPHYVGESSGEGNNELLRRGAIPLINSGDVLERFGNVYVSTLKPENRWIKPENTAPRTPVSETLFKTTDPDSAAEIVYKDRREAPDETPEIAVPAPEKKPERPAGTPSERKSADFAREIETPERLTEEVDTFFPKTKSVRITVSLPDGLSPSEQKVAVSLAKGNKTPDMLLETGLGISEILYALTLLEVKGYVAPLPGGAYKLI